MDNFDIKKFVSSKSLLNENSPGYYDRKSGEALPTLAGIQAAYEAKNGIDEADAGKTLFDLIGDLEKAIKLIHLAKKAGADAAKFQNFQANKIVSK